MKIDYATLISPFPLHLPKVGNVKSPTLKEIWSPDITYLGYNTYLLLLTVDVQTYCQEINPQKMGWFNSLSDKEQSQYDMFDIISKDEGLQEQYKGLLEFFFIENVAWDKYSHVYITYNDLDDNNQPIPIGVIHRGIWNDLCDIILQRCGINRDGSDDIDESKVKSKRALEILKAIKNGKNKMAKKNKYDKDTDLPNIISKVAVMAKSINYTNIWNLTVFQIYEQFRQECTNVYFDISTMSVAAWGNEKKTFKGNEWYKNEN